VNDDFQSWLVKTKGMQLKSARDVVSRFRRTSQYLDDTQGKKAEQAIFEMTQNEDFKRLSLFVRSQLKRAIRLHDAFERSNKLHS
jgi:hypothetical protein